MEDSDMRTPNIAGTWYPDSAEAILKLFADLPSPSAASPRAAAIIVPHAGYVYSGRIAAMAFASLPPDGYDRVILLAPSHHCAMPRAFSPEPAGDVATPFGAVRFSAALHDRLAALPGARFVPEAHPVEHAIDIELPLVKHFLPHCDVGALLVGQWNPDAPADAQLLAAFADAFRRLLDPRTLVVVSSDFTHYGRDFGYLPFPPEEAPRRLPALDKDMFRALADNDNARWSAALHRTGATICGASCLHLLLSALPASARFERLAYATSADATDDWTHVVGYTAAAVYADWREPAKPIAQPPVDEPAATLSEATGRALLRIARDAIHAAVLGRPLPVSADGVSDSVRQELRRPCGAFVTLHEHGDLRGCIGLIESDDPLEDVVREMAVCAALRDPRFDPVRPEELPLLELEISVLTPPEPIPGPEDIVAGRDGVILTKYGHRAVFLPQVATEQGWDVPTLLSHLSLKAGLPPDAWRRGARLETFRAQIFPTPH